MSKEGGPGPIGSQLFKFRTDPLRTDVSQASVLQMLDQHFKILRLPLGLGCGASSVLGSSAEYC
jgi:hypothetical protein